MHRLIRFVPTLIVWLLSSSIGATSTQAKPNANSHAANVKPASKATSVALNLRTIIASGRLEDLHWPNFSDYRVQVQKFYQPSYALVWIRHDRPTTQALAVINILQSADTEGLHADDYDASRWPSRLQQLDGQHTSSDKARFDIALTVCTMRYVSDLRIGRVNPRHFKFGLNIGPKKLDLALFVHQRLVTAGDPSVELAKIEPPFAGYKRTRTALLHYLDYARQDDGQQLPFPPSPLNPGDPYDGIPRLIPLLRLVGDLQPAARISNDNRIYQQPLVDAVKRFQWRHGLEPDGRLDKETIAALNVPLSFRVEQIRLAMERWRWLPLNYSQPPIVVNIPEFYLRTFDEHGDVALIIRVNVGEAYEHETPVFEQKMSYLVFRPYWDVPPSIQRNEIVPDIEENPDYLRDNGFEVLNAAGKLITNGDVSPSILQQIRSGQLRVRQKPGPDNALGLVKFIFPNQHNVYLHDTSEGVDFFSQSRRDLSHGCIHVEEPAELAAWILRDQPQWTLEKIETAMQEGRDNVRVNLSNPIPVLILYETAVVEEDGQVFFFHDIYGYDEKLEQVLAKGHPYPG